MAGASPVDRGVLRQQRTAVQDNTTPRFQTPRAATSSARDGRNNAPRMSCTYSTKIESKVKVKRLGRRS
jgi:hypothetical protein